MVFLFRAKKLKKATLAQRLMGKEPRENGFIKLNNLFAQQPSLQHLAREEVYDIITQYNIQLRKGEDKARIIKLYAQLLRGTFVQKQLDEARLDELLYFKQLFRLSDTDVSVVHRGVIKTLFKKELDLILSGRTNVPTVQLHFLRKLQAKLMLPHVLSAPMYREKPVHFLQQVLQSKAGQPLGERQAAELRVISKSMSISLPETPTLEHLHKCRLYWCIENGLVPQLSLPSGSAEDEICYLILPMQWVERRQKVRFTHYGETLLQVKVMEGLYWKSPLPAAKELAKEVWEVQDKGDLYLTSKRLYFSGERGNKQLQLCKISNLLAYENGLDIQRKSGEGVFFSVQSHADLLVMLLGKGLSEL